MKKINILFIITRADVIGGASVHLLDLAFGLKQMGHTVLIISGEGNALTDDIKRKNISHDVIRSLSRKINPKNDILAVIAIYKKIKLYNPDIVHLHSSKAGVLGRFASKLCLKPNIFTAHGWSFTEGVPQKTKYVYIIIERIISMISNKIITVSYHDEKIALDKRVCGKKTLTTIHNGIPWVAPPFRLSNKTVKAIMVARFDNQKNQKLLIEAVSNLKHINFELVLVGGGPTLGSMVDLCNTLNLNKKVTFLGVRKDVAELLLTADIFILTSNWEGLPLTILEAMRSCLPIIASDVGGVSEAVKDNDNGFLISNNNKSELEKAIENLVTSRKLREKMGNRSREIFESHFTFDRMLNETISVYNEIMGKIN